MYFLNNWFALIFKPVNYFSCYLTFSKVEEGVVGPQEYKWNINKIIIFICLKQSHNVIHKDQSKNKKWLNISEKKSTYAKYYIDSLCLSSRFCHLKAQESWQQKAQLYTLIRIRQMSWWWWSQAACRQ